MKLNIFIGWLELHLKFIIDLTTEEKQLINNFIVNNRNEVN